jgi:hypothetical protein
MDALEPGPGRRVLPERSIGPVGAQQRLLHQVFGPIADQPAGQPVQGRQLGVGRSWLFHYISHLHIAVSGFIAATGLAVLFLRGILARQRA